MQKLSYLQEKKFPFITFGQTELSTPHAFADIDNYDLGYRGATYLYSHGCKNIVMTASSVDYTYTNHKYFGVKRASMEYGIDFDREKQTIYDYQISSNYRKYFFELFKKDKHPDGVFCGSEISSLGCLAALNDLGIKVNQDVFVINIETCDLPSFYLPPIPGLRQNFHSIGTVLSKYLVKLIEGEDAKKLQYIEKATFYAR